MNLAGGGIDPDREGGRIAAVGVVVVAGLEAAHDQIVVDLEQLDVAAFGGVETGIHAVRGIEVERIGQRRRRTRAVGAVVDIDQAEHRDVALGVADRAIARGRRMRVGIAGNREAVEGGRNRSGGVLVLALDAGGLVMDEPERRIQRDAEDLRSVVLELDRLGDVDVVGIGVLVAVGDRHPDEQACRRRA